MFTIISLYTYVVGHFKEFPSGYKNIQILSIIYCLSIQNTLLSVIQFKLKEIYIIQTTCRMDLENNKQHVMNKRVQNDTNSSNTYQDRIGEHIVYSFSVP